MPKHGFKIADCDMHVLEPADLWERYMDPRFKDSAPRGTQDVPRDIGIVWRGKAIPEYNAGIHTMMRETQARLEDRYAFAEQRGFDATAQLQAMDQEGVEVGVMFPSRGLFALAVDDMDPAVASAIARAYNDWLADFCSKDPSRLFGAAMLPPHDVDAAIHEARRAVRDLKFRAAFMRPNPIRGRYWNDPYYYPLWEELQKLGIPIGFHEGGSGRNANISQMGDRFDKGYLRHTLSHPLEMMHACTALCLGGVLERFPSLRVAFLEANCSWLPWLLWRMDEHAELRRKGEAPDLKEMPSDVFKRQCFASFEADEETGIPAVTLLQGRNLVFSTDFPHVDAKFPHSVETLLSMPIPQPFVRRLLWDNWVDLYGNP